MRRIDEDQWRAIALALHREVATHVPEWTSVNTDDPGVTLLEPFAFLTTDLMNREHAADGRSGARGGLRMPRLRCNCTWGRAPPLGFNA
jgi:hypothetical protein